MSRLSRLRSFWRSLRRGQIRDGGWSPHRAVNLLPAEYRDTGTPPERGSWVLSASTDTKERGTRTPETATTAGFSSSYQRGFRWAGDDALISLRRVNSSTEHGVYTYEMVFRGASGAPRGLAT